MPAITSDRLSDLYDLRARVDDEIRREEARLARAADVQRHQHRTRAASLRARYRDQLPAIREWARFHGYDVGSRGRVPLDVLEAFHRWESVR